MKVKKRDGSFVLVRVDEITDRIASLCYGLDESIDPFKITQLVVSRIHDGISTSKIDSFTAEICAGMSITHPHFGTLASRLIISDHHKNVSCQTGLNYTSVCEALYNNKDQLDKNCPLISDNIYNLCKTKGQEINNIIDIERDFLIDFFGFKTLHKSYLLKVGDKVIETPQHMFLRVALGIHGEDLVKVKETYDLMSSKYFTHATPTLYNSGTPRSQIFSCFLIGMDDSLEGIFKCLTDTAHISKWSGGIGIHITGIRGNGSYIRGTSGKSDGIVPMLKVFNDTARYINQGGGKRLGSFAMYIEPWHSDIEDFLMCKLPHGSEERRAKDLFYALWVNDLFMERVEGDAMWSLMCPSECPGLADAVGDDFKELYEKYEREKRYKKRIEARKLWNRIIDSQIETGTPYITYKDAANQKSNQKNLGTIRSSNLCSEIIEYSDDKKYACCVLASLVLPTFVIPVVNKDGPVLNKDGHPRMKFDHKKLYDVVQVVTRNLDKAIDLNFYPVPETRTSNMSERPLGIGVQGLADVFFQMRCPYDSTRAATLNREIFETIYFSALTASNELAKEKGPYPSYEGSPMSQGKFQFDLWNEFSQQSQQSQQSDAQEESNDDKSSKSFIKLSGRWDWEALRNSIKTHGIRNSLLTALMPTASTSQIMGSAAEAFEPITSNIYSRRTLAGEFAVVNKYLADDLLKAGLWNNKLKNKILKNRGSIQGIEEIPEDLQKLYKTVWEIKQKVLIDLSADRGVFIDQSQSLNLFFDSPTFSKLNSAHFYGWKKGLKTGSYYIRSKPAVNSEEFTLNDEDDEQDEQGHHSKLPSMPENDCENCGS